MILFLCYVFFLSKTVFCNSGGDGDGDGDGDASGGSLLVHESRNAKSPVPRSISFSNTHTTTPVKYNTYFTVCDCALNYVNMCPVMCSLH